LLKDKSKYFLVINKKYFLALHSHLKMCTKCLGGGIGRRAGFKIQI